MSEDVRCTSVVVRANTQTVMCSMELFSNIVAQQRLVARPETYPQVWHEKPWFQDQVKRPGRHIPKVSPPWDHPLVPQH